MPDLTSELHDMEQKKIAKEIGAEMLNRAFSEVHFEYDGSHDSLAEFNLYATQHDATRLDLAMGDPIGLKLDDLIESAYGSYTDEAGASGSLTLRVGIDDKYGYVGVYWKHHQRYARAEPNHPVTLTENFVKDISEVIGGVASLCVIDYYGNYGEMDGMDFTFKNSDGNLVFPEKDTLTDILQNQVEFMIQKSALKDFASGAGGYGTISIDTLDTKNCYWNNWKYITKVRSSEDFFDVEFDYPAPSMDTLARRTNRVTRG